MKRDRTLAEIYYKIEAEIVPSDTRLPKLKHKMKVPVRESSLTEERSQEMHIDHQLKTCCCINKGKTLITAYLENSKYVPG